MKQIILILLLAMPLLAAAQFAPKGGEEGDNLTVIVTDGTFRAKDSPQRPPSNAKYTDPIRPLGMVEALQAGAFLEAPAYGKAGFSLIF